MKIIITALFATALGLTAAPASAETWSGKDAAHDHVVPGGEDFEGRGDIVRVRVDHAPRKVYVDTEFRTGPYDEISIFLNTRKARKGPEFVLHKTFSGVTLWTTGPGQRLVERVKCADKRVRLKGGDTWKAYVARDCLAHPDGTAPARVKVLVRSADDTYENALDWARGRNRATPWIHVN
jgi:hypothetical protein